MNVTSSINRYGVARQNSLSDELDAHAEDIRIKGFTIMDAQLGSGTLDNYREALDVLMDQQIAAAGGRAGLEAIGEADVVRAPLAADERFLEIATNSRVMALITRLLGDYFILSQQNGILNRRSDQPHHQTAFHRDLPYQHFVSSRPLAINALFCIDPFTPDVGSTVVIPGSHMAENFPSDAYIARNEVATTAQAGHVLVMDSMLFHRAGVNRTSQVRRGINHLYTIPILKQQISFPALLGGKWSDDASLARFLGYASEPARSVEEYRAARRPRGS